jgi:hypothetical protein
MMTSKTPPYHAIISSDWNECLAPCGPFDSMVFCYPELRAPLARLFRQYTANRLTLPEAMARIGVRLPGPISLTDMDRYLKHAFEPYTGVVALIEWCAQQQILFMINTTGMTGYFQRAIAKGLLPQVPVLAAHGFIRYPRQASDPPRLLEVIDIQDKARHTQHTMTEYGIAPERIVLIGDSGGDGPHFAWGAERGAYLIASMVKPSLTAYCRRAGIQIDHHLGRATDATAVDFRTLIPLIQHRLNG